MKKQDEKNTKRTYPTLHKRDDEERNFLRKEKELELKEKEVDLNKKKIKNALLIGLGVTLILYIMISGTMVITGVIKVNSLDGGTIGIPAGFCSIGGIFTILLRNTP